MVSTDDYPDDRKQTYVKHVFLASYLERLVHKTASVYPHIVYVDGFAGPWQSKNEQLEDTSFGIALSSLRRARGSWMEKDRDVQMSAFLVERDSSAYQRLAAVPARFPDIEVHTFNGDFTFMLSSILGAIPNNAFTFFLIDPKGWKISLRLLQGLLARPKSEVVFNFMFDFINRAASMKDPEIIKDLDELIPIGDWRRQLEQAESSGEDTPEERKAILVEAFGESLKRLGDYPYVAETTILRAARDRPHYCLFYATRHTKGIEVFRDCQISALKEQSETRASTKISHASQKTGQGEFFTSLHEMAPDELESLRAEERAQAQQTLLNLTPKAPSFADYEDLRAQVLARHIVSAPEVNKIASRLYQEERLRFPGWEKGKRVPQRYYRTQRP